MLRAFVQTFASIVCTDHIGEKSVCDGGFCSGKAETAGAVGTTEDDTTFPCGPHAGKNMTVCTDNGMAAAMKTVGKYIAFTEISQRFLCWSHRVSCVGGNVAAFPVRNLAGAA